MQRGRRPIRILLEKRLRHRAVAAAAALLLYLLWALLLDGGDPVKEPVADVAAEPAVGAYVHGDGPHAVGDLVVDVQDRSWFALDLTMSCKSVSPPVANRPSWQPMM